MQCIKRMGFAVTAAALLTGISFAQTAEPLTATVTIAADQPGAVIRPEIFGQFAEHVGAGIYGGIWVGKSAKIPNTKGYRNDVVAALKELHVPVVRWPGGCFADEYHWRDGVGLKRPATVNSNWGGVPEPNTFGTAEFMNFAELIGAKTYVNANMGTGGPGEAADWLKYITSDQDTAITRLRRQSGRTKPWKLDYFAMGNETWGCGGNLRAEYYADQYRQYATFVRTPPGQRPLLIASGSHDADTSWTKTLMSTVPFDMMDAIAHHYYTIPSPTLTWEAKGPSIGFPESGWIWTLSNALKLDDYIKANIAEMDKVDPKKRVGLYIDEWGTWYDPEPGRNPGFIWQQNTMRDAVVAAVTLNFFETHADRLRMANIAQMVNVLQAMILTEGPKMLLTPTYHVFHMYVPFQGATALPTTVEAPRYTHDNASVPAISAQAAKRSDGSLAYALVNLDPNRPITVTTTIRGSAVKVVSGRILSASAMDARNTFDNPQAVKPKNFDGATLTGDQLHAVLPPKSVVVLTLQ